MDTASPSVAVASTEPVAPVDGARGGPWWRRPFTGRRGRLTLVVTVLVVLLSSGGIYAAVSGSGGVGGAALTGRTNSSAPGFSLPELTDTGRTLSLSGLRGHDVVLNFWASWCAPCQAEMPVLQAAHASDPGVQFVGIDTNDTRSDALGFLRTVHVRYVTLFDPHASAASAYGLLGLPTTVFVSAHGKVLGRHAGQLDASTLTAALRQAFGRGFG